MMYLYAKGKPFKFVLKSIPENIERENYFNKFKLLIVNQKN